MKNITGKKLKKQWKLNVKHCLYRKTGDWYHILERFPAALCDSYGYVIFDDENDFFNHTSLRIGVEVNVPNGISSIPRYVRVN